MDLLAFKSLLFLLSFIGSCVGNDILPAGPVDVILGKDLTLKILVEKNPDDIIIWNYSDGKEQTNIGTLRPSGTAISDDYKGRASINSTNGYLTLKSLKSEDSGDYSINLVTTTTKTAEVKVRVLEPVSKVVIKSNLPEAFEYNSTVELTCTAEGSFLNFTWTNNTKPIVIDGIRLTEAKTDLSSKLTIRRVLRSDLVGPIYCNAANTLETEKSNPFNLTVYYGPDEVSLNPAAPPQYISSKSNYTLTCLVSSYPTPTFTWYRNEDQIKNSGPVLTMKTLQDQGLGKTQADYKCVVQNPKTLRFVESPVVTFSVMEPIEGAKITGPTAILIANNSTANLSCTAAAGVVKDITWMKDGKTLSPSARVVFSTDKSSVRFESVQKDDNGKYTCKLANPVNSQEAAFQMVVNYGPEEVKVNGNEEAELEDTVTLTCEVKSVPVATYTWKLNNTVLAEKTKTLSIAKAAYKDSGNYTCEAYNSVTGKKASSSHFLSVKEEIDHGLSDGAIAGIVIACLVAAGASIALFFYCRQKVPVESPY